MPDLSRPVLLIGGGGFIGSAAARQLARAGARLRCLVRPGSTNTARLQGLDWERVEGDITDAAAVARAVQGCRAVVHLASPTAWRDIDSPALESTVAAGTANVLDAAKDLRVVYVSSVVAVDGSEAPQVFDEQSPFTLTDPALRYAHAKHGAEKLCREAAARGVDVVVVNPAETYGPGDTGLITAGSLKDFANSAPVMICTGGTSVVHVDDVAAGVVAALERGRAGERYILGGDNLTVRALAELTLELLGRKASILTVPNGLLRWIGRAALALNVPLPLEPRVIPYATRYWFVDSAKARRELGVSFRPAREVLAPTLAWLREAGHIA